MTEEVKPEVNIETQPEQKTEEKEYSPVELKAMEMGWRPKEEFHGDEEDFVDAKEFVGRKPLFDKIESVSREAKSTRKALEALQTHYTKVKETEFQNALKELKQARSQALVDGDAEKFNAIDEDLENIAREKDQFMTDQRNIKVQDEPSVHPEFAQWIARNSWYETQPHMHAFAEQVGARLQGAVRAGTMTPQQVLKEIEKSVREEFPNRFRNANKDKPGATESPSRSGSTQKSSAEPQLTDIERNIMNTLVRGGHITKEKYLADLAKVKEQK